MKITRNQLHALINEEVTRFKKSRSRRITEATGSTALREIDSADLLDFAQAYSDLGTAVQEQLRDLLDMQEEAEVNPNAVEMIRDALGGMNDEIDLAVQAWLDANG